MYRNLICESSHSACMQTLLAVNVEKMGVCGRHHHCEDRHIPSVLRMPNAKISDIEIRNVCGVENGEG